MEFNKPKELCVDSDISQNFVNFKKDVLIYFAATETGKKSKPVQVARLKNLLGTEGLLLYESITTEDEDNETVSSILETLENHCVPKKNDTMDIFKFFSYKQSSDEPFERFFANIKKLVRPCEFGNQESKLLKAQIILGLYSKVSKEYLLRKNFDLQETINYCKTVEQANLNLNSIDKLKSVEIDEVKSPMSGTSMFMKPRPNRYVCNNDSYTDNSLSKSNYSRNKETVFNKPDEQKFHCSQCGYSHERQSICPAKGKICKKCGKWNHFSSVCRTKLNQTYTNRSMLQIQKQCEDVRLNNDENVIGTNNETILSEGLVMVESLQKPPHEKAWFKSMKVEGVNVNFKLDSGSEANILPYEFVKNNNLLHKVEKCKIRLEAFGGFQIDTVGTLNAEVETNKMITVAKFLIVKNCSNPLIGLDLCIQLNLIKKVEVVTQDQGKVDIYNNNKDLFEGVGCFPDICTFKLTENARPKMCSARRIPLKIKDKFKDTLDELVKKNIITSVNEPVEWVSNIAIVEKPNGSLRICIDPKELNKYIVKEKYTIPTLEEISPNLSNKKYFCILDIKDGFYHVKLDSESSKLCSFSTIYGTYRFLRAPFGLACMPEIFQKLMFKYFGDITGVSIYFDDLCISGESKEEVDAILNKVFRRARQYNIKFNYNKLQYCVEDVKYLGVIFNKNGMRPDPEKIACVKSLKKPNNKTELQQLLGFINYLRPFIPNMAELTAAFRELLKKNTVWQWTDSHSRALEYLKQIICSNQVLAPFKTERPVEIQCDASRDAIGCCILQDNRPVSFASRCLSNTEKEYAQIEKEFLAITYACSKFHYYIYGQENVIIHTDHMPLLSIMKKSFNEVKNNRLRRLKLKLLNYKFELRYLSGKKMFVADLLSRNFVIKHQPDDNSMNDVVHTLSVGLLTFSDKKMDEIQVATGEDEHLKNVLDWYNKGWPSTCTMQGEIKHYFKMKNDISVEQGLVYYENRLVIPIKWRNYIIELLHESHLGIVKTKSIAKMHFYWPGIMAEIETYISRCPVCLKYSRSNTPEPLLSHEIPDLPFNKIGLDIAQHAGVNYLIIFDYFSRWLEVITLRYKTSLEIINKLKDIFSRFGIPGTVIADNMPFGSLEVFLRTGILRLSLPAPTILKAMD
jgi:hypothetical protein